jgi:uncharacterized protein YfaS (alpha-2-macroglobulin family)
VQGDDFVLSPYAPAFVAPGDEFTVSVGVSNNLEQAAALALQITASPNLEIVAAGSKPSIWRKRAKAGY